MQNVHRKLNSRWARWSARCLFGTMALATSPFYVHADESDKLVATGLTYTPRQPSIAYDKVEDKDKSTCTGKFEKHGGSEALVIYNADGQVLRRFADTNNDRNVDQWCYFKDGIEVYRDIDSDFNGVADQYRWLGTAGLRWGIDKNEDGKIDSWKAISAEEVTIEVVEAMKSRDEDRFKRLLLTDTELKGLRLGEDKVKQLTERVEKARTEFSPFTRSQKSITGNSRWTHFAADKPGVVPAGTDGLEQDLTAYENVIAIVETDSASQQVVIGTLVQIGSCWKMTELPRIIADGASFADAGFFFPSTVQNRMATPASSDSNIQELLAELDRVDGVIRDAQDDRSSAYEERTQVLLKLIAASKGTDEMGSWVKQFADSVSSAAQNNEYPEGLERLQTLQRSISQMPNSEDLQSYVAFRVITTENNLKYNEQDPNYAQLQRELKEKLSLLAETYPTSQEASEAMIQIGINEELGLNEKEAEKWYRKVADAFPQTQNGKKAAGAIARLNLEGKTLSVRGKTINGKTIEPNRPTIVHYWATWCQPCKADMEELRKLQSRYAKKNLQIVGVNLDTDRSVAENFLKQNEGKYPWAHMHEDGGFESDSAVKLGVLSVPVTILIDAKGVVTKRTAHFNPEMASALERMMDGAPAPGPQAKVTPPPPTGPAKNGSVNGQTPSQAKANPNTNNKK